MKPIDEINLEMYKSNSEEYGNLLKKLVRILPSNTLIAELKRRKLIKFDWIKEKYMELKNGKGKKTKQEELDKGE